MVDINNIGRIANLMNEKTRIEQGLDSINKEGIVGQVMLGSGKAPNVMVPTAMMNCPDTVVKSLREMFQNRLGEIEQELSKLGVTGVTRR